MKSCSHDHPAIIHDELLCPLCATIARLAAAKDSLARFSFLWQGLEQTGAEIENCRRELETFRGSVEQPPTGPSLVAVEDPPTGLPVAGGTEGAPAEQFGGGKMPGRSTRRRRSGSLF